MPKLKTNFINIRCCICERDNLTSKTAIKGEYINEKFRWKWACIKCYKKNYNRKFNCGMFDRVMTSPDGINWTSRTPSSDIDWYSVTWSPELGLFCAVSGSGTGNRVMTSPDGITWTSRVSAADNSWRSVTWSPELGIFAAVSGSGALNRVMTSFSIIDQTGVLVDVTGSRAKNTTYININTRPLKVRVYATCITTVAAGTATMQAKSDASTPPTTVVSGVVGIDAGLLNQENLLELNTDVSPGQNYRVDTVETNGTVTIGKWFERVE